MPPSLALFLCIIFILFLFRIDIKRVPNISKSLWIPLIWMMIISSRHLSQWLHMGTAVNFSAAYIEGNAIDRYFYLLCIILGIFVLSKRKISWSQIFKSNPWLLLLFLYSGFSILWSDFPAVSAKRWVKSIGNLLMVLIVLTDSDAIETTKTLIRRCSYVLLPLSVLLIKYYPHLGKVYDPWTGAQAFIGVGTSKNMLGTLCLVCGLFFSWNLLTIWQKRNISAVDKKDVLVHVLFLFMIFWLFKMVDSATSLMCFIAGICIIIGQGHPIIKRNNKSIGIFVILFFLVFLMLQLTFEIAQVFIFALGRDITMAGRVDLWEEVLNIGTNPLLGTGFESFWLGDRLERLWANHWWRPNQSHSGYIETYLNLGYIGLFLLAGIVFSSYKNICRTLTLDFDYGRFKMAFLIITLIYNITEAGFKGLHIMFFIFLLIALEYPRTSASTNFRSNQPTSGCDLSLDAK